MNLNIAPLRKVSLSEAIQQQQATRGIQPLPLEPELLLARIKKGGHSGVFLAAAFASAYRRTPFIHSLGDLIKLDAEAFRLFHGILHMRHTVGWSDDELYQIETKITGLTA